MKRILLVVSLAASALLGSVLTASAGAPTIESSYRTGFLNCLLVDEAVKLNVDPRVKIPDTAWACSVFRRALRYHR